MASARTIPGLFDEVVTSGPERVALIDGERRMTYAALRGRADALADRLRAEGVGPETVVGVGMDRSADLVVALLAVLKAGGAYLPLPPEHPKDRLRALLDDAQASLVITVSALAQKVRGWGRRTLLVDDVPESGPASQATVPEDCLAYVIYTSGSTGQPKGVGVTHRNALNLVRDQDYVRFGADEVFLQLAPTSFDASAFEIWGALLHGARLVIPKPSYAAVDELPSVLRDHAVTTLLLTPSLFHELVGSRIDALSVVRRLIVGGEAMSVPVAQEYARHAHSRAATLANVYGPTETTTLVSCYDVMGDEAAMPIGRPINNVVLRLLDPDLRPVPVGAVGEIHIGGTSVTRGYLGRPGLTARSFVPDPFRAGARMYATGDLGRLREDGSIEFVGRNDGQVKIRGHRVELSEVEHVLNAHDEVRVAAVVDQITDAGSRRLVAHIVAREGAGPDLAARLRGHAAARLPGYLCPSVYRLTERLVLSPAGKVDREALRALPAPPPADAAHPGAGTPGTAEQRVVTEVWRQVLGVADIGLDDDFFVLGGDSIQAIRTVTEAESRGVTITLADLFAHPTIRALCPAPARGATVSRHRPERDPLLSAADQAALAEHVEKAYPATLMQLGLIFEGMSSNGALYHDVISRRVNARFDAALLRQALDLVVARHEALRASFDLSGFSVPLQLVHRTAHVPLVIADRRGTGAAGVAAHVAEDMAEAGKPFDVGRAPLIRLHVTRIDDEDFQITYGFHHAIMDGWSETVFSTELFAAYDALLTGTSPDLGDPPAGHEDLFHRERDVLASHQARCFWRDRCAALAGEPGPTDDGPRTGVRTRASRVLPATVRAGLTRVAEASRVPLKSLLVAAHLVALRAVAAAPAPTTGLIVNCRPESTDGDRLVGMFLNVVPVSVRPEGTWEEFVRRVFDAERALLPHRHFPYPALQQLVSAPLCHVVFNYVHFHRERGLARLDRVQVGPAQVKDRTSYPLSVEWVRSPHDDSLTLELSADPGTWSEHALDAAAAAHLSALGSLAEAPAGAVPVPGVPPVTPGGVGRRV